MLLIIPDAALSGGAFFLGSRVVAVATDILSISPNATAVQTGGYFNSGDGGEALYVKGAGTPNGSFVDAGGQT